MQHKNTWLKILGIVLIVALVGVAGYAFVKQQVGTVRIPPKENPGDTSGTTTSGQTQTDPLISQLHIPNGFAMNIFARDVKGARVIEFDPKGRILVSQTSEGKITALADTNSDGTADNQKTIISGLNNPHGLAFHQNSEGGYDLYVAESNALNRFSYDVETATLSNKKKLMNIDSSVTDRHSTRTLLFLPSPNENTLLISVGSSCNVCNEEGQKAKILSYNVVTGKSEVYATGLRNAVFMTLDPLSGKVFATEMGRDGLGDNTPPDEINSIEKNKNYGWPICYGKNIHDTEYDKNTYIRNPCMEPFEAASFVDLQAHSAPLGLAFIPEEGWSEDMWYDLLVAYHGSWNRSEPTGYKIVRLKLDAKGSYSGTEDFITGWLTPKGTKIGRPADIKVLSGGTAYISDDQNGVIYRLTRTQ